MAFLSLYWLSFSFFSSSSLRTPMNSVSKMLWNWNFDCTCWRQLATSTLVDVPGIFLMAFTQLLSKASSLTMTQLKLHLFLLLWWWPALKKGERWGSQYHFPLTRKVPFSSGRRKGICIVEGLLLVSQSTYPSHMLGYWKVSTYHFFIHQLVALGASPGTLSQFFLIVKQGAVEYHSAHDNDMPLDRSKLMWKLPWLHWYTVCSITFIEYLYNWASDQPGVFTISFIIQNVTF